MSQTTQIDPKFLPNLPGFRTKTLHNGVKKNYFQLVDGQVFLKDEYNQPVPSNNTEGEDSSITSLANTTVNKARKQLALQNANIVLKWTAYFEEYVEGANKPQVRQCNIFFYVEDGTIKVVEKPVLNAGVSQGTLVKRTILNKPDGTPYQEEDFHIGDWITIYGRNYRIVDSDQATRDYLRLYFNYVDPMEPVSVPADPYSDYRKTVEPGKADTWGKFHAKKNENKTFNEARLGHSVDNKGREGFLKYGGKTLKFRCLWDDTQHLYGDVIEFTLTYYLSDDSLEIISIPSQITKETSRLKLLKRSKLPKNFHQTMGLGTRASEEAFFHWSDFYIGLELEVFGRALQVVDADNVTRDFYQEQNLSLGPPIYRPAPEVIVQQREVPPSTGFGSEEDSLRSVAGSLLPGPAPMKKLGENKVLSFFCSLLSGGIDDVERRFVITYYVTDSTLKIVEPPVRNSGFTGGVFLSRRTIKNPDGDTVTERDLYVGCKLRILKHEFLLLDTNETTLHWMEDKGFPRSNFYTILDKMRPYLIADAMNGRLYQECQRYEESSKDQISKDSLRKVLVNYQLCNSFNDGNDFISEHELLTILRANGNKKNTFNYRKFIEQIVNPTDEFK